MSYAATGTGSIVLNVASVTEQRNMQLSLLAWYDKCCAAELNLCGASMKMKVEREYQARKQKMQRYSDPFWWLTVVFKEVGFTEVDRNPGDEALSIELSYYHNYDEHAILELLEALLPYTSEGCISYCGEEGDYWRHILIGGKWTEQSGHICYGEVYPTFARTHHNMESLIEEIRRRVIHDDRRYEDKARALLKAFEEHDPDGVLCALSGRGLHENGVAAGIWPDGEIGKQPDERA